jgi:hypothetical protein
MEMRLIDKSIDDNEEESKFNLDAGNGSPKVFHDVLRF